MDDIAVIGIGCKVPGANNVDEYWRVLANSENHIVDIPKERWNNDAFYSENKDEPGKSYVNKAGFISGYDEWDNKLFGISDSEAVHMDPQQRQVLECTHMALEDAGITRKCLKGTETGVYLGVMNDDYKILSNFDHDEDTNYSATGMSATMMSARISYVFDLRGPCMVVDTACSSSMVAIHLGCQAIRSGDCDMAICGGVSSILIPDQFITLCKARMLSPSGQCQSFSDAADGYGRGEGCGMVILKSAKQAERDKNKIWGIVKTGSNQDGRVTQPITAPSGQQQEELLKKLYCQYGVDPNSIQYIEAHGTGTSIGDPTEVNAIGRFIESYKSKLPPDKGAEASYIRGPDHRLHTLQHKLESENSNRENDSKEGPILIGSVKSNIGHLESAAGVAALIKVLLMMKHGKFVPSLHIMKDKSNVNKKIALEKYGLDISLEFADWKQNKKGERICCVNCFGFGGSNTHAIVVQSGLPASPAQTSDDSKADNQFRIVVISGITRAALVTNIEVLGKDVATGHSEVKDLSFTSICHRDHFSYRTLVFGIHREDIKKQLGQKLVHADKIETEKKLRIIFVFCGVGTTWTGMCQEMMNTQSVFRKAIDDIDAILQPLTGWSIAEKFLEETDYSEPFLNHISLFCAQVALFELWKSWGIRPDGIVGQSVGEVAASYASGALALPDAVKVIYHRSLILSSMTGGKMMVAGNIEVSKLESLCQKMNNRVAIAVFNSPVSCTVSGDADAIDQLKTELEDINKKQNLDIMIRPLTVQCAYHSSHMEPCVKQIKTNLSFMKKGNRTTDHFSTVTGKLAVNDDFQTGTYWADNIRRPVLFSNAITRSADDKAHNVFIEIGPRPVLRAHLNHIMGSQMKGVSLPSMSPRKETESIYTSLSTLFELGVDISWANFVPTDGNLISLPRYIFQKTKMLHIPKGKQSLLKGSKVQQSDSHIYVKRNHEENPPFVISLDTNAAPFVYDHYLFNAVLVPGATYVEAAFEIGHQMSSLNVYEISVSVEFENTHMPVKDQECLLDLEVEESETNEFHFHVSKESKILSKGIICPRKKLERKVFDIKAIIGRCKMHRTKTKSYECLQNLHFRYGESLSVIEQSWASSTECVVEFVLPESVLQHRKLTHMHPSVVDGMFQTFGILSANAAEGPTLPKGLGSMVLNRPPEKHMFGYSRLVKSTPKGNHYNSFLLSTDGHVMAEIFDFYTKSMVDVAETYTNMMYSAKWHEAKMPVHSELNEKKMKEKKLTIISSERFMIHFKNSQNSHSLWVEYIDVEDDFSEEALGCLSGSHSVVYAPFFHIDNMNSDGAVMFECVKRSFLHLSQIITYLRDRNEDFPVFIVTENTIGYISKQDGSSNVCGAELWGMVRSMISEDAYQSLILVDMTTTDENVAVLKTMLEQVTHGYNEFTIEGGKCYTTKLKLEDERGIPYRREINADASEEVVLISSSSTEIKNLFFDIRSKEYTRSNRPNKYKLNLQTFCLHNSLIFPISKQIDFEEFVSQEENSGYPLICIEGIGQKQESFSGYSKGNSQTVFCYPVNVSTVVSVPEKCTFDITTLPIYIPGMMTVGILVWNVVEVCKMSTDICVVVENRSEYWIQMLTNFLSDPSKSVHIQTRSFFSECTSSQNASIRTLVILSELTNTQLDEIVKVYPSLEEIVSLDDFFPKSRQVLLKMKNEGIVFTSLKTEEMFMSTELTKTVPTVYNKLKSMENKTVYTGQHQAVSDQDYLGNENVFKLPYPVLPLYDENTKKPRFPLQVTQENVFRTKSCYILVGGLTGLGWELLQFMAELGVKYIAALSRSLPSRNKENDLEKVRKKYGCRVIHLQADITILSQLTCAFDNLKRALGSDVDIRGIFHGGGVTRDKLLKNMSSNDAEIVLLPKVLGTWNLHLASKGMPLDFFTMHSSIVSIFGNQGQCNYAAANSFQDSFAKYRRNLGLPGQSINWSTLSLGMATENKELEKYLSNQGFHFLTKSEIRQCFLQAVMSNKIQIMFGKFDWHKMKENSALTKNPSKFSDILTQIPTDSGKAAEVKKTNDIFELSADPEKQKELIKEVVKSKIAEAFVIDEGKLSDTTKILTLGIDSMAAMSFTNAMYDMTKVRIPIGTVFDECTTVAGLATFIVTHIETGLDPVEPKFEKGNDKAKEYLSGTVTFMQRTLLDDFVKNPFGRNLMRQIDFEISGLTLRKNDLKIVFNHLIKTNPDLRRIYEIENDGTYHSHLLESYKTGFDIQEVEFKSICEDNTEDTRDKFSIDITKEIPIRVMFAFEKDRNRIRVFVHAILGDLTGLTNLFREFGDILKCHLQKMGLPEKNSIVNPAEAVRSSLMPRINELRMFWNSTFKEDVHPFTFFPNLSNDLDENYWQDISQMVPESLFERMMNFINSQGLSIYHFIMSVYMVLLHERTGRNIIPLVTFADMRSHVLQLQSVLQSCSNSVPVVCDLRNMGTVTMFLKTFSDKLNKITQNSAYPYELIEDEMGSEELKLHIGRHRFYMENMTRLRNQFQHNGVSTKIGNLYYKRHVYETTLHIEYDMTQNIVNLRFGYNGKALAAEKAEHMLERMQQLIHIFLQNPHKDIVSILQGDENTTDHTDLATNGFPTHDSSTNQTNVIQSTEYQMEKDVDDLGRTEHFQEMKQTVIQSTEYQMEKDLDDLGRTEDFQSMKQTLILTEQFMKQTTQGWEHSVDLKLSKKMFGRSSGEIFISWGRGKKQRTINGHDILEVEVKKIIGTFYVLIKTRSRPFVFKAMSSSKAMGWINTFKQVAGEMKDINRQEMISHL